MRKVLSSLLVVAIALSMIVVPLSAEEQTNDEPFKLLQYGDANQDGKINDKDVITIARYIMNWGNINVETELANVDGDSSISDKDVIQLKRFISDWHIETRAGQQAIGDLTVDIHNADTMRVGDTFDIACEIVPIRYMATEEPVITYTYFSTDEAISARDGKLEAKKAGIATVTVQATAVYKEAGVSFVGSGKKTITVEDPREKTAVTLETNTDTTGYEFRDGGYAIERSGNELTITANGNNGINAAKLYLEKFYSDGNGGYAVPADFNVVEANGSAVKKLTINGVDISEYTIVLPSDCEPFNNVEDIKDNPIQWAGAMLRRYIQFATDVRLENTNSAQNAKNPDYIIEIKRDEDGSLGEEGYQTTVENGKVTITGGANRGWLYGVYDFLEKYVGYRFIYNDSSYYVYPSEHVEIANGIRYSEMPGMSYRDMSGGMSERDTYKFPRKNNADETNKNYGGGIGTTWYHAHSFGYQIKQYYIDKNGGVLDDGIHMTQPCLTDEANFQECKQSIIDLIEDRHNNFGYEIGGPGLMQITVAWNDNENYCRCSACRKVNKEEGSGSGTLVRFVNRMADEIGAIYPGIDIFTIGYGKKDIRVPTKTKLRDNVVLCYCWNGCNNHPFSGEFCTEEGCRLLKDQNKNDSEYFKGWVDNSSTTYTWYYCGNYQWYLSPLAIVDNIYYDFKWLAENGCDGIYAEMGSSQKMLAFEPLMVYLMSRSMWEPSMSKSKYDSLKEEYLELYYGDGWQYLDKYLDMQDEASNEKGDWLTNFSWPMEMASIPYYAAHYEELYELFDKAEAMANNETQKVRIQRARLHMEFYVLCGLYEEYYGENSTAEQKAFYTERYNALYNYIMQNNIAISSPTDADPAGHGQMTPDVVNPITWYGFTIEEMNKY